MGDRRNQALRVQFDGKIKLRFHAAKITSDAGLFAFRELDEAFRLTEREKLNKIGAKVVRHAKYVTFQMAEMVVPRELFATILDRIQRFGVPPPLVRGG